MTFVHASWYSWTMAAWPKRLEGWLFAVAMVGIALLARVPVWHVLGAQVPFITFFPAILLSAWRYGFESGLIATVFGALATMYLFFEPRFDLRVYSFTDIVSLVYYAGFGILLSWVVERMRRARAQAEAQRALTHHTLASVGDGVITTDTKGCITLLNPVGEELTGWTLAEAQGRDIHEVFRIANEDTDAPVENPVDRVLREGKSVGLANHTILIGRDGRRVPIDDSGAPILDDHKRVRGAVLVFRNISERRDTERRVRLTEQRLTQLAKSGVIGVLFGDIYGRILDANDEFLRIIGRTRAEMQTGTLSWTTLSDPGFAEVTQRALEEAKERGSCTPYEKEYIRPDGTHVPVMVGYVLLEPEREKSVAFIMDLTARKAAEEALRRLNEDLQHFTYGASHDLKEPLRMIGSYVQLLSRRYKGKLDADADDFIQHALDGVNRMRAVVDALLEFSRAGDLNVPDPHPVQPVDVLHETLESLEVAIDESGAQIDIHEPMPPVLVRATHLAQIFQNLLGNSIRYRSEHPPVIRISARRDSALSHFKVEDNGAGVAPEFHQRIFGAFQRLHGPEVPGTGLGLATTKRLIERYGGTIWVDSKGEGHGSTFHFTLPLADGDQTLSGTTKGAR